MKISLTPKEMEIIRHKLKREPNEVEWAIFDAVWSEHCAYKSSKFFLRGFSYKDEKVIMGIEDWQDAGAIDIGDGWALILKVESHNHPSAVDPFNGAATGVGGIIRDIISKGAKPIALLDMLRVGTNRRAKWLLKNIVAGIGFYGNSIGVPVIGGELSFDESYNDNPLVDVAGIGIVRKDKIKASVVKESGLLLVIAGETGLDGIGGASFASRKLSGEDERGAVQIADPFAGKIIIDVTLNIVDYVEAIKDLGGGGLAVAVTEISNGLGARVYLDRLPLKVKELSPLEMIVSETQERMLYAVKPENVDKVCKEFEYYEYPCAVIGEITSDHYIRFFYNNIEIASLPSNLLLDPPIYVWDIRRPKNKSNLGDNRVIEVELETAIRKVISHPDLVSKEWVYSQYDYEVGTSTVIKPGEADAAVIELPNHKFLAVKGDANPDWCSVDPYECGKGIVGEAYRNLATVGARGVAMVDHLQFGDPRKPEIYYYFEEALRGIAEASRFFKIPIVGGKVSFYNENNKGEAIKPTPLIVMAGLVDGKVLRNKVEEGLYIVLIGFTREEMNGSLLCKIFGNYGSPMKSRLEEDRVASEIVISSINSSNITFAKDVSKGGIIGAILPILAKGFGVKINTYNIRADTDSILHKLFSESAGRFIVLTSEPDSIIQLSHKFGVVSSVIGKTTTVSYSLNVDDNVFDLTREIENYYNYLELVMSND
ncbi:MAG: phosphoribosylformylglycinamidine synthase subunit PurL [Sulfolobaceae archaeon]